MYCQKTFIIVYLILTNKFLLKRTKILKNILLIISAQERLGVVSKQEEIYRYRTKSVEKYQHIG